MATPRPDGHTDHKSPSLSESYRSVRVGKGHWLRSVLAFAGPGYLVSVGYMDPGNWATDLGAGSVFGYRLLWVILASSLIAMLLQTLCVRMGVAVQRDLAQACREYFPKPVGYALWILCEIAIIACDLAEVIGSAVALKLLFGIPVLWGVVITGCDVLALLALAQFGFRMLEAVVVVLIGTISVAFLLNLAKANVDWPAVALGTVTPQVPNRDALFLAVGILGATVMPHNLYLHTSLIQTRAFEQTPEGKRNAIRFGTLDVNLALGIAFFVNAAIMVLAAAVFWKSGHHVSELEDAHQLLKPLLGSGAATLFAVALLASGQSSTITGTLAGQIVMEGFLNWKIKPWVRRVITRILAIVPAIFLLWQRKGSGTEDLLNFSQVILSLQLPFAVFPLVSFTANKRLMGEFRNPPWLTALGYLSGVAITVANIWLLWTTPSFGPIGVLVSLATIGGFWIWVRYTSGARRDSTQGAAALSVVFNVGQTLLKFAAALWTGSVALLSEAVHSLADILSSSLAYFSVRAAALPPDEEHPYGHGKIESLAGFAEAILLGFTTIYIVIEAIRHILHPEPLSNLNWGIAVLGTAASVAFVVGKYVQRIGKTSRSLALISNGQHLLVDAVTSSAVLLALLITRVTGWAQADPVIAFVLAGWMGYSSYSLGVQAFNQLIDRRLPDEEVEQIRELLGNADRVISFHQLRTRLSGATREVDVHIVVSPDLTVIEAHTVADNAERLIVEALSPVVVVVHVDPLDPTTVHDLS